MKVFSYQFLKHAIGIKTKDLIVKKMISNAL